MEIKIIKSKSLKKLEQDVNEFFFLADWFNKEPFYFNKKRKGLKHIAIIVLKRQDIDTNTLAIRSFSQNDLLKKDSELNKRLINYMNKFYPERQNRGENNEKV